MIVFVSAAVRPGCATRYCALNGERFRAALHSRMGRVQSLDASWIAKYISFNADSALTYCLRFRVNFRITPLINSIEFVV